jgi:hypothetical protein
MLKNKGMEVVSNTRSIIENSELDIYLPERKLAIEFNGTYWHTEDYGKGRYYHHDKWSKCRDKDIQLIQIWEDDWNRNQEMILKLIQRKAHIPTDNEEKIFARKTRIYEITKNDAEEFLSETHIQGFSSGSFYIGLRSISEKKLVAVMVLKKEARNDNVLNIVRYSTSGSVPGGFTKLLSFAEHNYSPNSFVTFSDHTNSDGSLYSKNGFVVDKELSPDYMYVVRGERRHKFGYRLKKFKNDENLHYVEGCSESQLAKLNHLPRIWDAGKTKWVKTIKK